MIRSAISPRFATRILLNGGVTSCLVAALEPASCPRVFAQRRAGDTWRRRLPRFSQRDVAVLLAGVRVALVGQHLQGADQPRTRVRRSDDIVDVAAGGRHVWVVSLH